MNIQHLDDVLIELANRLTQANTFSLTPKSAAQIIGQLGMDVRKQREAAERQDQEPGK